MAKGYLTVKISVQLRDDAKAVAQQLGLPMSTIISAYLRELIITRTIYFSAQPARTDIIRSLRTAGYHLGELRYQEYIDKERRRPWQDEIVINPPDDE